MSLAAVNDFMYRVPAMEESPEDRLGMNLYDNPGLATECDKHNKDLDFNDVLNYTNRNGVIIER